MLNISSRRDSVVATLTRHGMDGSEIKPQWGKRFFLFHTGPESARSHSDSCKMGTGLPSRWQRGRGLTSFTVTILLPRLRMSEATHLLPLCACVECYGKIFIFTLILSFSRPFQCHSGFKNLLAVLELAKTKHEIPKQGTKLFHGNTKFCLLLFLHKTWSSHLVSLKASSIKLDLDVWVRSSQRWFFFKGQFHLIEILLFSTRRKR
jgi:hypothetical protein